MTERAKQLLADALNLTERERADIAAVLIESLEPPRETDIEEAWRREVSRRVAELDAGNVQTVPWEQVRDELFSRLSGER